MDCFRMWIVVGVFLAMVGLGRAQEFDSVERRSYWIGYSEGRNDLPEGQFANWVTKQACAIRADGTERRELAVQLGNQDSAWTQFSGWSPDGRSAVILHSWEDPSNAVWEREHKTFRFTQGWLVDSCLVDFATGTIRNLTAQPRVSSHNTGLFFLPEGLGYGFTAMIGGVSKPFQMELDGSNKRDVSGDGVGFSYGYSVSPDGKKISYHEDYQIYVANADGTQRKRIETGNPFNFVPQWSPDGKYLLFVSGEHYNCHPYVVEADGANFRKLADRGGYRGVVEVLRYPDFHSESSDVPVWAADGKSVFYTAKVNESVELMRVSLEGVVKQLTHSKPGTRHYHPAVSPNHRWVLYGSDCDGAMQLYVAGIDGGGAKRITNVSDGYCAMHGMWRKEPDVP